MVLLRECDIYVDVVADIFTDQLILEIIDEAVAADHEIVILAFAACEGFVIYISVEVDLYDVVLLYGSVGNLDLAAVLLADAVELCVYIGCENFDCTFFYLDAFVVAEFNLGTDGYGCSKYEGVVVVDIDHLITRSRDDLEVAVLHCLFVGIRCCEVDGIIVKYLFAVHLLDHLAGYLTFTESRHAESVFVSLKCLVSCCVESLALNSDSKLCFASFNLFNSVTHFLNSLIFIFLIYGISFLF